VGCDDPLAQWFRHDPDADPIAHAEYLLASRVASVRLEGASRTGEVPGSQSRIGRNVGDGMHDLVVAPALRERSLVGCSRPAMPATCRIAIEDVSTTGRRGEVDEFVCRVCGETSSLERRNRASLIIRMGD
jgi:hypothetical protein